jgi:Sulfotransferase family
VLEGAFLGKRSERSMEQKRRRRRKTRRTEPLLLAVFVGTALLLVNQLHFATTPHPGHFTSSTTAANGDYDPSSSSVVGPSKIASHAAKNRTAAVAIFPPTHDSLIRPRSFAAWDRARSELPCEALEDYWQTARVQMSPASTGLMLVKTLKTGSSTAAGVTLRLAQQIARRRNFTFAVADRDLPPRTRAPWTLCKNRVMHAQTHSMGYAHRDRSRSFLWSIVREPTSRAVSHYFHTLVSRRRLNASDDAIFLRYLKSEIPSYQLDFEDYQIKYLSFHHLPRYNRSAYDPIHEINEILRNYDFVAMTERLDESLVAMQMLLGLDAEDIAHVEYVPKVDE